MLAMVGHTGFEPWRLLYAALQSGSRWGNLVNTSGTEWLQEGPSVFTMANPLTRTSRRLTGSGARAKPSKV